MPEQPPAAKRRRTAFAPRRCAVRLAATLLLTPLAASTAQQRDAVDEYVERAMAQQHIPGLSLAVIRNGRVIKAKGYPTKY